MSSPKKGNSIQSTHHFVASIFILMSIITFLNDSFNSIDKTVLLIMSISLFVIGGVIKQKLYGIAGLIFLIIFSVSYYNENKGNASENMEIIVTKDDIEKDLNDLNEGQFNTTLKRTIQDLFLKNTEVKMHIGKGLVRTLKIERLLSDLDMSAQKDSINIFDLKYNSDAKKYDVLEIQRIEK